MRHLLHEEDDPAWIMRPDIRPGLEAVAEAGLVYDLVGTTAHLPAMARIVTEMPHLRFVLDHVAKPDIAAGAMEPWRSLIRQVAAQRDHVWCKFSGMITEADWTRWKSSDLQPYIMHALAEFGARRCMFGSDWPVCLVAGSYRDVVSALGVALGDLDTEQHAQVMGGSAIEAYRLLQVRLGDPCWPGILDAPPAGHLRSCDRPGFRPAHARSSRPRGARCRAPSRRGRSPPCAG
nr:amidohydrolase family protein [uncultured Lichenicoccus sp.]